MTVSENLYIKRCHCTFLPEITSCRRRPPQYASAPPPVKLTIYSYLFARWHLFRHVGYVKHQQQVELWSFDIESGVLVTCDVGYLCANFSLPRPLSLFSSYARCTRQTDRQTSGRDVRQKHRCEGVGIIIPCTSVRLSYDCARRLLHAYSYNSQRERRQPTRKAYSCERPKKRFRRA